MNYFKDAKVGDKVWDYVYGEGEIYSVPILATDYLITVGFASGIHFDFTLDGKIINECEQNQRLFCYDNRPIQIKLEDLDFSGLDFDPDWWQLCSPAVLVGKDDFSDNDVISLPVMCRKVRREEPEETQIQGTGDIIYRDWFGDLPVTDEEWHNFHNAYDLIDGQLYKINFRIRGK